MRSKHNSLKISYALLNPQLLTRIETSFIPKHSFIVIKKTQLISQYFKPLISKTFSTLNRIQKWFNSFVFWRFFVEFRSQFTKKRSLTGKRWILSLIDYLMRILVWDDLFDGKIIKTLLD